MTTKKSKKVTKKTWHNDPGKFSMWLCLPMGMYAISHRWPGSYDTAKDPRDIQVRARKRKYLDRLRASYIPELGKDEGLAGEGTDYGHRAFVSSGDLARGMARMALDTDATGFKSHAWDNDLHDVYMSIWSAYVRLDDRSPYNKKWNYGGTGHWTWTKPSKDHTSRPQDCLRYGYHWFDAKDGDATCIDCGAVRTEGTPTAKGTRRYTFSYPPGAVILCTKDGRAISKDKWRRVPGGPAIVEGKAWATGDLTAKAASAAISKDKWRRVPGGPAIPSTWKKASVKPWKDVDASRDCLDYGDHWWANEGSAKCRDCGAIRLLDPDTGEMRHYYPEGSVMLHDELGYDIDDPHVTTADEVTEPPELSPYEPEVAEVCHECGGIGRDEHLAVCGNCEGTGEEPGGTIPLDYLAGEAS